MTRSRPAADGRSQVVPYGPRTPITRPGGASHSARVTAPTARIVCTSVPSRLAGSPLTEMATSPIPGTASMVNWPGWNGGSGSAAGSSLSATRYCVSGVAPAPPGAHGSIGSAAPAGAPARAASVLVIGAPVQVEQPGPGG